MKNNLLYIIIALLIGVGGGTVYLVLDKEPAPIDPVGGTARGVLESGTFRDLTLYAATTTDATSSPIYILGAKKITWFVGVVELGSDFSVQVINTDPDILSGIAQQGSVRNNQDFITYNKLISNVTNSNSQEITRVGKTALTVSTTTFTMDLSQESYKYVRAVTAATPDGAGAASTSVGVLIEW